MHDVSYFAGEQSYVGERGYSYMDVWNDVLMRMNDEAKEGTYRFM